MFWICYEFAYITCSHTQKKSLAVTLTHYERWSPLWNWTICLQGVSYTGCNMEKLRTFKLLPWSECAHLRDLGGFHSIHLPDSESTCLFSCVFLRLLSISKRISKPRALLQGLLAAWQGRHQLACRDALQQVLFSLNMFTLQLALQGSAPRKLMTFGCFCSCFHHAVMHQSYSQRFKGLIIRNHSNKCEGWNFWYPRFSIGSAPSRRSCICENAARSFLATPVRSGNSYETGRQTHNRRHSHADIKSQNPRKICWFASKQSRKKSYQIADGLCDLMGGENPGGLMAAPRWSWSKEIARVSRSDAFQHIRWALSRLKHKRNKTKSDSWSVNPDMSVS